MRATRISLLERLKMDGDEAEWADFVATYRVLLESWLNQIGVSPQDRDDIVQDVFTAVLKELPQFEHNGRVGAFRRWLRNVMANRLRRMWARRAQMGHRQSLESLADELADDQSELSRSWDGENESHILDLLLHRVSHRFDAETMMAFTKVTLEGVPPAEVAQSLGISLGALRVRQHRVLRSLREVGRGILD